MPRMVVYKVIARTVAGLRYTSIEESALIPDDTTDDQALESLDNQISAVWQQCLGMGRPFQLGRVQGNSHPSHQSLVSIGSQHLLSLEIVVVDIRWATDREIAAAAPQTLPEMHFAPGTEQPPA